MVCAAGLQHTNVTKNCPYCPYFMPFHFQSQSLEGLEHTVGQLIIVSPFFPPSLPRRVRQ